MRTFKDTASGQFYQFDDDVIADNSAGHYVFRSPFGPVDAPATLVPATLDEMPDPPSHMPKSVTALQGILALHAVGQLEAVEAMFNAQDTPLAHRLAFERAKDWQRASPTVAYMQDRMGWTDAYIDQLFVNAEKII